MNCLLYRFNFNFETSSQLQSALFGLQLIVKDKPIIFRAPILNTASHSVEYKELSHWRESLTKLKYYCSQDLVNGNSIELERHFEQDVIITNANHVEKAIVDNKCKCEFCGNQLYAFSHNKIELISYIGIEQILYRLKCHNCGYEENDFTAECLIDNFGKQLGKRISKLMANFYSNYR